MIRSGRKKWFLVAGLSVVASFVARPALAVVISEIHYHPPAGDEALEFVEISNDSATPADISGWALVEGIDFVIPQGTVLGSYESVVIAIDVALVASTYGIENVLGDATGRLDNDGERLTLVDHAGLIVSSVRFRDRGKWPVAPDGTGQTLSLRSVWLDPSEPESWAPSADLGGTPGAPNFPSESLEAPLEVVIDRGETWRFRRGSAPFSTPADDWLRPDFDDAAWEAGPSGFGFGDDDDATVLDDMEDAYTAVAVRKDFDLGAFEIAPGVEWFLGVDYDDGFCAFLNGTEIARVNCGRTGDLPVFDASATGSHEAGAEELFAIPLERFHAGSNTLAIAGYNLGAGSSDFSLAPRLLRRGGASSGAELPLVLADGEWAWRRGVGPFSSPEGAWAAPDFDDASWDRANGGFGFLEVSAATISYRVPAETIGNQEYGGSLGMDFDVLEDVVIDELGVFDSGQDGLARAITARLYDRSALVELASIDFTPASPGELAGGSRFKRLPQALVLPRGFQGTIVAEGYGAGEPNGNQGSTPLGLETDDGGGAIAFTGGGRYGNAGAFPGTVDGGPVDRYAAGTFTFRPPGAGDGVIVAPPGAATLLADMPGAYASIAARARFTVAPEMLAGLVEPVLTADWDDAFVAFLNGVEIARANTGAPGIFPQWNDLATSPRLDRGERRFLVDPELLVPGENVLALVGYNAALDDADFSLRASLVLRTITPSQGEASRLVFNELFRGGAMPGFVEIYNPTDAVIDLSGFTLTDGEPGTEPLAIPQGTSIASRGYLSYEDADLPWSLASPESRFFLIAPNGLVAAAAMFDRATSIGGAEYAECRFPDGGDLDWLTLTPTPGARNEVARTTDIVLNEIFYHPPLDRPGEFIELYNRGTVPIDIGGFRFSDGIDYTFPQGTVLAGGAYLVIAEDPGLIEEEYGVEALGPWTGSLANEGESLRLVDRLGNPVDAVRYHDGGEWSLWADGRGSSLELVDPYAENEWPASWRASDESEKADWEELRYTVDDYQPASESELSLYLVERGICLVDDISIRDSGGAEFIPNGGFEASTSPWRIGGTHVHSTRTLEDSHSGGASLRIESSGRGDTLVNRIETDTSSRLSRGRHEVSLFARWIAGGSVLVVHGEYHTGPFRRTPCITCGVAEPSLSGNSMSAGLRLTVPFALGTPHAENSATRILREATGASNLGPTIALARHDPPLPEPGEPVHITAHVADPDGVARAEVLWALGNTEGALESVPMVDDGLHDDGGAGDGVFGAVLAGFSRGARVAFFIEAEDTRGRVSTSPLEAPSRSSLFFIGAPADDRSDTYRFALDTRRTAELQSRELHSNDLLDGTFVFETEEAYSQIGVRYRGSPWGRPSRLSYRVRFPDDHLFHRGVRDVNISKTGGSATEGAGLFLIGRNSRPGRPAPVADYLWVRAELNGADLGAKGAIQSIDRRFLERWFDGADDGPLLKADGRFVFTDGGGLTGQQGWEGASLIDRGENPENYRGYFRHGVKQSADDWSPLIALVDALDPQTPNEDFFEAASSHIDLDMFFRVLGARILLGDGDAFGVNNGHNGYMARNSRTGLWTILAFDVEAALRGQFDLFASLDPAVARLLSHPATRRIHMRLLDEYVNGYWSVGTARPWLSSVTRSIGLSTSSVESQISAGANRVRSALDSARRVPFRILTNGGSDLEVDMPRIDVEGDAPITIETILLSVNDGDLEPVAPNWSTPTRWKSELTLGPGRNELAFLGFDGSGDLAGTTSWTVTVTGSTAGFFTRGDSNADGSMDLSDPIFVLAWLFRAGSEAPPCVASADADDSGKIDLTDAIYLLDRLFRGGPPVAPPAGRCGTDPTPDDLGCESFPPCGG